MNLNKSEVVKMFPMPTFRKYQKETIERIVDAFNSGVRCILYDSPTGSGKSGVNVAIGRATDQDSVISLDTIGQNSKALSKTFYITPQLTLIDQLKKDRFIGKYIVDIKGRQNYPCNKDPVSTCDIGLCKRVKDCNCQKLQECSYWIQKMKAIQSQIALTSFSYFVLEGNTETQYSLGRRELLILDEAHSIDRHIVSHISLTVSPWSLPFELYKKVYPMFADMKTYEDTIHLVRTAKELCQTEIDHSQNLIQLNLMGGEMSITQATNVKRLEDFSMNADRFLNCQEETEWVWQVGWSSYHSNSYPKLYLQPLYARPFMVDMVWSRAKYYIVSTATILNVPIFIKETGLDKCLKADEILHINVPSTFPVENRPIIDRTAGKMSAKFLDVSLLQSVKILEKIIDQEGDSNIAVHCHSYKMSMDIQNLIDSKYKSKLVTHTSEDRLDALEKWKNSRGMVLLAVSFEEGQDWTNELFDCRAQVLFKVPFMDISDRRVARRLEKNDWGWYRNEAMKTVIQSYGRAVRTPTDTARFYVIDACFLDIIRRCKRDLPKWFTDALPEHMKKLVE